MIRFPAARGPPVKTIQDSRKTGFFTMHEDGGKDSASAGDDDVCWRSGTLVMTRAGFSGQRVNFKHSDFIALRVKPRPFDIVTVLVCSAGLLGAFANFVSNPAQFEFDFSGVLALGFSFSLIASIRGLAKSGSLVGVFADGSSVVLADINRADETEVLDAFERFRAATKT
jgi:hypothetical protein